MATIESLERYIAPHLPGAARPLLREYIRRTLDDFLTRTEVWKITFPTVNWLASGKHEIPPATTLGAVPARIVSVRDAETGDRIPFKTHDQLDEIDGKWPLAVGTNPKFYGMRESPGDLLIYPNPPEDQDDRLIVRAAMTITDESVEFPDFVFSRYLSHLVNGIVGNVLSVPGKDFTNLQLAGARLTAYEAALPTIKSAGDAEFGSPERTVMYGGL